MQNCLYEIAKRGSLGAPEIQGRIRRGLHQVPMSKVGRARNAGRGGNFWWHFCVCWYYTTYNTREWIEGIVKCLFTHTLTFRMA